MKLNMIGVFAETARSQGYAQALFHYGYSLEAIIIITKPSEREVGQGTPGKTIPDCPEIDSDLFFPDFSIPLIETVSRITHDITTVSSGSVNHEGVINTIKAKNAQIVIYSGFGGEIVSADVLRNSPPMLHMHSGDLPRYRGSTTVYYSMLQEKCCSVSAILLSEKIDTGDILKRSWYPLPPSGVDIDYHYDTAIRSDTMIQVLKYWEENNSFDLASAQSEAEGDVYYIIHPVLKHLAILSLDCEGPDNENLLSPPAQS